MEILESLFEVHHKHNMRKNLPWRKSEYSYGMEFLEVGLVCVTSRKCGEFYHGGKVSRMCGRKPVSSLFEVHQKQKIRGILPRRESEYSRSVEVRAVWTVKRII